MPLFLGVQAAGVRAIGSAPNMQHGAFKNGLMNGYPIARTHDDLMVIIREMG